MQTIGTAILFAWPVTLLAQASPPPEFEVASVKPVNQPNPQKGMSFIGGTLKATNYTLRNLIGLGWDVRGFQITGGPGWLDSEHYDIEAKPAVSVDIGAPDNAGRLRLMVQSLVTDRFSVKLHRETREVRVYSLVVGKNGVRLKRTAEAAGPSTSIHDGKGFMAATQIDLGILARNLAGELEVPVIDRTGLAGAYDLRLEWSPADDPATPGSAPSIFTALQEQLGLRLESGRGPVEMLVIDSARKASQN